MTCDTFAPPREHLDIVDALLRLGAGIDHADEDLLATALTDDAVVDFTPCGRTMGLDFPVLTGGQAIVAFLRATAKTQTTTHVITNARARIDGGAASLRALVDATHLPRSDHRRRCEMMNWYYAELVENAALWRIDRLVIENAWFTGDTKVLLGQ